MNDHRCSYVSIRFHPVLKPIACVAWRFWLGGLSNEDGRGHKNRAEIGAGAIFIFLAASPLVRPARQNRCATQAIKLTLTPPPPASPPPLPSPLVLPLPSL